REQQKWNSAAGSRQFDAVLTPVLAGDKNKDKKAQDAASNSGNPQTQTQQPRYQPGNPREQETRQFFWLMENSKVFSQNAAYQGQLMGKSPLPPGYDSSHPLPEQVVIRLSPMMPLWLPGEDHRDRLVLARR